MHWKAMQVALLIGISALATEVSVAASSTDAPQPTEASAIKIDMILDRWQAVEASKGGDVALWRDMMSIQLRQVNPSTLDRLLALNTGPTANTMAEFYQNFVYTLGTDIALRLQAQKTPPAKAVAQSVTSQAAGDATPRSKIAGRVDPMSLGSAGIDQTFTPITPCRVVDTRNVGGPIGPFVTRNFFFYTATSGTNWSTLQGGVSGAAGTVCPGTVFSGYVPSAAVATITVTGQGGNGNLIVWQGTSPVASASTMSYFASGDIAVLAVIPGGGRTATGPGGAVQDFGVFVNAFTPTNVVVDIVGYYTQPAATALQCTYPVTAGAGTIANGNYVIVTVPACQGNTTRTGVGCFSQTSPAGVNLLEASLFNFTDCTWINQSGASVNAAGFFAESACCSVPGH